MPKYVVALDQGTTSSRAMLVDANGCVVDAVQNPFPQVYPQPGWVEHDPRDILSSQLGALTELLVAHNLGAKDIDSIGITNQRETTVVWNRETGEPVMNAIVWQCRRTAPIIDELTADPQTARIIADKTGLVPDAYFSASKIKWILDHVEGAREDAEAGKLAFGTVDTWLIWTLTQGNVHATDVTNASRTMLYNIHELRWDPWLLDLFGIPESLLPEVLPSSGEFGRTASAGIVPNVPICGVAGDQQAALFGQTCFRASEAKNTYGTGGFLLMNTGRMPVNSQHGLLTTIAWGLDGKVDYALEGSIFVAGAAIQWLRDELKLIDSSQDSEYMAQKVKDSNGCYVVPAFTGLGAPHWDQYARGTILGITRGVNKCHIIRATLESIAFQVNDVLKAMEADGGIHLSSLKVDGGASQNNLLMQMQADISGAPVHRPACVETTAMGAAYLAGLAVGYWDSKEKLSENMEIDCVFEPQISEEEREKKVSGWKRAVRYSYGWAKEE